MKSGNKNTNKRWLYLSKELKEVFIYRELVSMLSSTNLKKKFHNSLFGAFWINLTFFVKIGVLTIVFSKVFITPIARYLPHLILGVLIWEFMSKSITLGCSLFDRNGKYLLQFPHALSVYVASDILQLIKLTALNFVFAIIITWFLVGVSFQGVFWASIGILILLLTSFFSFYILGVLGSIYPDFRHFMNSLLTIGFVVSPVLWSKAILKGSMILRLNPFNHYLNIVRTPLLKEGIPIESLVICTSTMLLFAVFASFFLSGITRKVLLLQ